MLRRTEDMDDIGTPTDVRLVDAAHIDASVIERWQALAKVASEPNAFAENWFVTAAIDHLRGKRDVRLAQVWGWGNDLIGIIPLTRYSRYGRIPVRHISNWTHYQSFMGTPLIARGRERAFWRALITALDASDWAVGFLSMTGLDDGGPVHVGLIAAAASLGRKAPTVHRFERALLSSPDNAETYLAAHVRGKKRKELRRLANRLAERGDVRFSVLDDAAALSSWCDAFLTLEAAGWKGSNGAALANNAATANFFRDCVSGAFAQGRLDFQRLDLDGAPIAMLVNFRSPPGSWSFKIAYDEGLARFSPGVLIELENLGRVQGDPEIEWMDSCAVADHPMINGLWAQRRAIIQVSVPLVGAKRGAIYRACRAVETASARLRQFRGRG